MATSTPSSGVPELPIDASEIAELANAFFQAWPGALPSGVEAARPGDLPAYAESPSPLPTQGLTPGVASSHAPTAGAPTYYWLTRSPQARYGVPGDRDLTADLPGIPLPETTGPAALRGGEQPAVPDWSQYDPAYASHYVVEERREPTWDAYPETGGGTTRRGRDPRPNYDLRTVRRDFPILSERVSGGKQLVWFDNAATTQKPRAVIDRLSWFYEHENSNIHRAAHELAARATDAYEGARGIVARFVGADAEEIVWARGTTEAINLVAASWGRANLREGDEVVISHLEHHANIVPWQLLAKELGFTIKVIPVDDHGELLLDDYTRLLTDRTKLVSVTHVSNALGTITPIQQIVDIAHRRTGAKTLVDAAQSIAHIPIDVKALDTDFLVFSGHKIYGPTGIGVLYGKREVLEDMPPYQGGGNMISDVTLERSLFHGPPARFEAGTGNIADAVGLGTALEYLSGLGLGNVEQYEHDLLEYATARMLEVPGLHLIGTAPQKASVLSFVLDGYEVTEVGEALSRDGIAVRAGHHCAQPILRRMGLEATVRPSLALYNTCEEVDQMVEVLAGLASARPARG